MKSELEENSPKNNNPNDPTQQADSFSNDPLFINENGNLRPESHALPMHNMRTNQGSHSPPCSFRSPID